MKIKMLIQLLAILIIIPGCSTSKTNLYSSGSDTDSLQKAKEFYYEDFSEVKEGLLPAGWKGGEKLMVKHGMRENYITDFEKSSNHKLIISNINFPDDFEFIYTFQFGNDARSTHMFLYLGNITVTIDVYGWYVLNNSRVEKKYDHRNKTVQATLRKEGNIFKLFINGEEVLIGRYPEFNKPISFSLEFQNMTNFKLYEIVGYKL